MSGTGRGWAYAQSAVRHRLHDRGREEDDEQGAVARRETDRPGAERAGSVAEKIVEAEHVGAAPGADRSRDDDLLDREERAGLAGADGDVAHDGGEDNERCGGEAEEHERGRSRQRRERQERGPWSQSLRGPPDRPGE